MADVIQSYGSDSNRRLVTPAAGHLGVTSDERVPYVGRINGAMNELTKGGEPLLFPQVPRSSLDVRRLFHGRGQLGAGTSGDTWTDEAAVSQDASGWALTPKAPNVSTTASITDPIASGVLKPYELADGGRVVMTSHGRYTPGSVKPAFSARVNVGGTYVDPQYETHVVGGSFTGVVDVGNIPVGFLWSSDTCGYNALGGYDAAGILDASLPQGEFQWELEVTIESLGRYAKWSDCDADSGTLDSTCKVTARLRWGVPYANVRDTQGLSHPYGLQSTQIYGPLMYSANPSDAETGVSRGEIVAFNDRNWLCFAQRDKVGYDPTLASPNRALVHNKWAEMLAEDAPGIGWHWREFFVPAVSEATFTAYANIDWTVENQVVLELGGPRQTPLDRPQVAYSATDTYFAEYGRQATPNDKALVLFGGDIYAPRRYLYSGPFPALQDGLEVVTWTESPDTAVPQTGVLGSADRAWRKLAPDWADRASVQVVDGYVYGGRRGNAQVRV